MKLFYTLLLCIVLSTPGLSQVVGECLVQNDKIDTAHLNYSKIKSLQNISDFEPITFNLYFWGFRLEDNSGNTAFNQENIENAVGFLNALYNQCNISFNLLGYDTVLSNEYYTIEPGEFLGMIEEMRLNGKERKDAFNIYVSNQYSGFGGAAYSFYDTLLGIPAVQLINTGTLEHEMGHCFNLHHTNNENNLNRFSCESTVRDPNDKYFNADITGDFVIDTAAAYMFSQNDIDYDTCTVISNKVDCFGFKYQIPSSFLKNYMTISASGCEKDNLTQGQFLRVRQAIELDPFGSFIKAIAE